MPKGRYSSNGMSAGHSSGGHADGPGGGGGGFGDGGGFAPGGQGVEPHAISQEPRQVVVEQYSRTRHQVEPLTITFRSAGVGGGGRVMSSAGHEYETTPESCTCPDFRVRHHECRHIRAMRNAMGLPPLDEGWRPGDNTAAQVPPVDLSVQRHEQDEEMRNRLTHLAEMDAESRFASDDENIWREYLTAAQESPVYETENVLDGPDGNTFGVEIEFVGGDLAAIGRELHAAGLTRNPSQEGYHSGVRSDNTTHWRFERDGSVDGEIVSPPLRDTPETWAQIQKVCEVAKRHGARVDSRCGAHVHVGKTPLDQNRTRKHRLLKLVAGNEDIFFRMAAAGEMGGQFRGFHYVDPIANNWRATRARTDEEAERRIGIRGQTSSYPAINMRNETVEFRYFNGTLTPEQIQANIKLAYNTVSAAAITQRSNSRSRFIPSAPMAVGNHASGSRDDISSVKGFLDAVFTKSKDKVSALRAFVGSQWVSY